jgi:hemolysin III
VSGLSNFSRNGLMSHYAQLPPDGAAWRRSRADELINAATHGLALAIAIVGALEMMRFVSAQEDVWLTAACAVYAFSLVAVYTMSTLSHSSKSVRWKSVFRRLDQAFIYILIVATYTPFSLVFLPGAFWRLLLVLMWAIALCGFAGKVFLAHRVEAVSVASYLVLGWIPIIAIPVLWRSAPPAACGSLIAGGLCYTFGTLFLIYDERVRYFHAAWHLCVIAGSVCHYLGMLVFVVGVKG